MLKKIIIDRNNVRVAVPLNANVKQDRDFNEYFWSRLVIEKRDMISRLSEDELFELEKFLTSGDSRKRDVIFDTTTGLLDTSGIEFIGRLFDYSYDHVSAIGTQHSSIPTMNFTWCALFFTFAVYLYFTSIGGNTDTSLRPCPLGITCN